MVEAQPCSTGQSAMVRGVEVVRGDLLQFNSVHLTNISSAEGVSVGFDIITDENDRTNHEDDIGIRFKNTSIDELSGHRGTNPFDISGPIFTNKMKGISIGKPEELDSSLRNPR